MCVREDGEEETEGGGGASSSFISLANLLCLTKWQAGRKREW